jgi:antibiotic biosynthesis monooxygenase (ABM) superfamily enzyme
VIAVNRPAKHHIALVTWLGLHPLVTALGLLLSPVLSALPMNTRPFVQPMLLTAIAVPIMDYVLMPILTKTFRRFCTADPHKMSCTTNPSIIHQ